MSIWGTVVNAAAILLGGGLALAVRKEMPAVWQHRLRLALGLMALYNGFKMMWEGWDGFSGKGMAQIGLLFASLILGGFIGTALAIQKRISDLGKIAERSFAKASGGGGSRVAEGFVTCTILFCVGPMTLVGAFNDGLYGDPELLLIKSVMDGISTMAFTKVYGWGTLLSAIPVFVFQGTVSLLAALLGREAELGANALDAIGMSGGYIVLGIALMMFGVKRVPIANYMPALFVAPVLAYWALGKGG